MVAEERRVRHQELVDWLVRSRLWSTALHHLEFLTAERTRALLRAGDNIHAAAEPGGPTPLSIAQDLAAAARPVIHARSSSSRRRSQEEPRDARAPETCSRRRARAR